MPPQTVTGKSGRKFKIIDPDERCPECHKTARELDCKTVMAFGIHKGSHSRPNAKPISVAGLIKPKKRGRRSNAEIAAANAAQVQAHAPNSNGNVAVDVEAAFKTAMGDVTRAMILLQFASLLPRISIGRAQDTIAKLTRGVK
jgi:hypothetical protein